MALTARTASSQTSDTSPTSSAANKTVSDRGRGAIGWDKTAQQSGNADRVTNRVRDIFGNRGVNVGTDTESEQERLDRIAQSIMDGSRTFSDVRFSVDRIAGDDNFTRASQVAPQPLTAADFADLAAQRGAATSNFRAAQIAGDEAQGFLGQDYEFGQQERARMFADYADQMMAGMGDRGMAFQPAGAGQGSRQIGEERARADTAATEQFGRQQAEIAAQVAAARRERDQQLAFLEGEEARRRSAATRDTLLNFQA